MLFCTGASHRPKMHFICGRDSLFKSVPADDTSLRFSYPCSFLAYLYLTCTLNLDLLNILSQINKNLYIKGAYCIPALKALNEGQQFAVAVGFKQWLISNFPLVCCPEISKGLSRFSRKNILNSPLLKLISLKITMAILFS